MSMGCTYKFFESSLFLTPFLTSPHLFNAYKLCFLFPEPFPPIPPLPLPTDNPPCDVHFSDSVPILVVYLVFVFIVFSFFFLGSFVDSCEFVVILLFIVFDLLQFLR